MVLLQELYETTLNALQEAKNERLWFKTNTKLGKLYFDLAEYGQLQRVIKQLHAACKNQDGSDDQKKGKCLSHFVPQSRVRLLPLDKRDEKFTRVIAQMNAQYARAQL